MTSHWEEMRSTIDSIHTIAQATTMFENKHKDSDPRYDGKTLMASKQVLIAFDEAHWIKEKQGTIGFSLFIRAVRRGSRNLKDLGAVVSLCGTNSDLSNYAPPREYDESLSADISANLMPPFLLFFEDTLVKDYVCHFMESEDVYEMIADRCHFAGRTDDIKFFLLGRPLWMANAMMTRKINFSILDFLINTAKMKLGASGDVKKIWMCIFMSLVSVSFKPTEVMARNMVSYSMAVLMEVSDDRRSTKICCHPETLLSIAAYELLLDHEKTLMGLLEDFLTNVIEDNDLGNRGEFIAQLHLLDVCFAVRKDLKKIGRDPYNRTVLHKGLTVRNFVKKLVATGDKDIDSVNFKRVDAMFTECSIMSIFRFVQLNSQLSPLKIRDLLCRGLGSRAVDSAPGYDLAIPYVSRKHVGTKSCLLFEVKNRGKKIESNEIKDKCQLIYENYVKNGTFAAVTLIFIDLMNGVRLSSANYGSFCSFDNIKVDKNYSVNVIVINFSVQSPKSPVPLRDRYRRLLNPIPKYVLKVPKYIDKQGPFDDVRKLGYWRLIQNSDDSQKYPHFEIDWVEKQTEAIAKRIKDLSIKLE